MLLKRFIANSSVARKLFAFITETACSSVLRESWLTICGYIFLYNVPSLSDDCGKTWRGTGCPIKWSGIITIMEHFVLLRDFAVSLNTVTPKCANIIIDVHWYCERNWWTWNIIRIRQTWRRRHIWQWNQLKLPPVSLSEKFLT